MSNDIAALAQSMKAAAEKATPGRIGDRIDGSGSIKYECRGYDGSLVLRTDHKNMEYGFVGDNGTADEEFFRACVPDNILALVEALEKAQKLATQQGNIACALFDEVTAQRQRIAELESMLGKPVLLPKTNGYWTEQEKAYEEAITLAKRQVRLAGFSVEDM